MDASDFFLFKNAISTLVNCELANIFLCGGEPVWFKNYVTTYLPYLALQRGVHDVVYNDLVPML